MKAISVRKFLVTSVVFVLLASTVWLGIILYASRSMSEMYINNWAEYAGGEQAQFSFLKGRFRLFELSSDSTNHYTGRKVGDLEIWTWTGSANTSWLLPDSGDATFVKAYNARMNRLWANKQKAKK
jgi:hypothetical protein